MKEFKPLTLRENQIITGTILGGSSLIMPKNGKNCYLSMRDKNAAWLETKADALKSIASPAPFTIEKTNRWHSLCVPELNGFREKFYKDGKRHLRLEVLERLWDVSLAVWYQDCGLNINDRVIIKTHIWGEEGTELFKTYFELIDYQAEIVKERGKFRVRLDQDSSKHFLNMVLPILHPIW